MCIHVCINIFVHCTSCTADRELSFVLRLNPPAGSDCNPPSFLDRGIRLEYHNSSEEFWQPIRFYTSTTTTTSTSLVTLLPNNRVNAVAKNYESEFPLYINNSTEPFKVTEYLCASKYFTSNLEFRWLQRYKGATGDDRDPWFLSNVSIGYWNNREWCTVQVQQSDFDIVGGSSTPMCEDGNEGENTIFFSEGTLAPDLIPRRRVIMTPNWNTATCSIRNVSGMYYVHTLYIHVYFT